MGIRWKRSAVAILAAVLMATPALGSKPPQDNEVQVLVYFQGDVPSELLEELGADIGDIRDIGEARSGSSALLSQTRLKRLVTGRIDSALSVLCHRAVEQIEVSLGFSFIIVEADTTLVLRCPDAAE